MTDTIPDSVRIRTGGNNSWRYRSIERASELYDMNRSDSVAYACEDVVGLWEAIAIILTRPDLTHKQRQQIAETIDDKTSGIDVDVPDLDVELDS